MAEGGRNPAFSDEIEDSDVDDSWSLIDSESEDEIFESGNPSEKRSSRNECKGHTLLSTDNDVWWEQAPKKLKGIYVKKFAEKVNAFTRKSIGEFEVTTDELSIQIQTGVEACAQEYAPLGGFSAQTVSRAGKVVTATKYVKEILKNHQRRPCAIVGNPACGKTFFMKRLAKKTIPSYRRHDDEFWRKVLRLFRRGINVYDVTLYLSIKDFGNFDGVTLAQTVFNPKVTGLTAEEAQHGLHAILKKKIKAILFFDGIDQTCWQPNVNTKVGPWTKTTTAGVFGNILAGHLLPEVPIAISSTEHWVAHLPQDMQPTFVASLYGLSVADAKTIYTQMMGAGAEEEWEILRTSNPRLFGMCLTPLFLLFYVITSKCDPTNPPDCTSAVMVRIIQKIMESRDHLTSDDAVKVVNKLKRMAFEATRERRTIFTNDHLKRFEVAYCDVKIMKIIEPNILEVKILQGIPRKLHFCHQVVQDVLAALHVAEMSCRRFEEVVSRELRDPSWSVVRTFMCGMLMNERVLGYASDKILNRDGLEHKCDYVIMELEARLRSTTSQAEKLDVLVALREANALDILQRHTEHLDLSDSPFTLAMMNVLCSELRVCGNVESLILRNCALDDELLNVLARLTSDSQIKIGVWDVRGNVEWTKKDVWRKMFENLNVTTCMIEIPCDGQNEDNAALLLDFVKAADHKVKNLHLGDLKKIQFKLKQIEKLAKYDVKLVIDNIRIAIDERLPDEEWIQVGSVIQLLRSVPSWQFDYSYLPHLKFLAGGYGNVKFRRFTSWSSYQLYVRLSDSTVDDEEVDSTPSTNAKVVDVEFVHKHLPNQPFGVGQLIRECGFEELVFYWPYRELDVPAFASGLEGFKIKLLAVKGFSCTKLVEIVRRCDVEKVYLDARPVEQTMQELEGHTDIVRLSEDQWNLRFRVGS